ncbi:MAG TPA: helix-turn-helix domain-containing protein [Acetobacteraceae bacterium]
MPGSTIQTFANPYDYQASVRAADLTVVVAARGEFKSQLTRIDLHRLWMQRSEMSLPSVTHSSVHKNRNPILFLADAQQRPMTHSGIEVSPGDIVFNSSGAEHHHRTPANCLWGAMSLTPEDLATYGRTLAGRELTAPAATRVIRPQPALMSRLLNLHKGAGDLAATAPDILAHPEVAKALEQAMVRAMIACLTDPAAEESYRSNRQRLPVMRRFERMLGSRQDQPLYLTEVCAEIGVTDRTLRLHCQEHLGMSPHRYLWLRRMNLARRALTMADGSAKTVTEIANDHGFGELGRFAVSYRRLFGESPSVTLRRPPDDAPLHGTALSDQAISGFA